jgi:hypothetical protein
LGVQQQAPGAMPSPLHWLFRARPLKSPWFYRGKMSLSLPMKTVHIENFRGIRDLNIDLDLQVSVF